MRITSCNALGSGTNNELDAIFRGRIDKQEEGMNIIVVGFNLNLKKDRKRNSADVWRLLHAAILHSDISALGKLPIQDGDTV
jgi:hypothetical protein